MRIFWDHEAFKALSRALIVLTLAFIAFIAFMGAMVGPSARAQMRLAPTPKMAPDHSIAAFARKLDEAAKGQDFVGLAVAVVDQGEIALLRTYGVRNRDNGAPIDAHTRFRIASLSKGFASAMAAQLVVAGKLQLDAPVRPFAPTFSLIQPQAATRLTIEHVLSHRTGLPPYAYDNLLEAHIPVPDIFDRLAKVRLICATGDCYSYQNIAYSLIEPVVLRTTGLDFERAVSERLFAPLKMADASYGMAGFIKDDNWARPYVFGRNGWKQARLDDAYYQVPSAGGVNASIHDMALWLAAQMGAAPEILSPEALSLLHSPRVKTRAELRRIRWLKDRVRETYYGLGWRIYDYAGRDLVMHNGGLNGYRAQIAFMPESGLGVVALWNSMSDRGWSIMPTLFDAHLRLEEKDWLRLTCSDPFLRRSACPSSGD
ncbi:MULTISPECIES: serine hydrolase domain-containing protein [unclassified Iodidimonas]|jgi:beta-lactamase class C|uniref:serine hydrolase domain-containing protein n=1 Tax=unclassified Iodidimonas TaxID=2626145 RepID=UPI0024824C46|nr:MULTISPECIES: serine hydrolase domain-containing protein [unclassified Iodidimonas]